MSWYLPNCDKSLHYPLFLKDRLTYHRWLVFFSYGIDEEFYQPEFKKLPNLLRGDDVQVNNTQGCVHLTTCLPRYVHKHLVFKGLKQAATVAMSLVFIFTAKKGKRL